MYYRGLAANLHYPRGNVKAEDLQHLILLSVVDGGLGLLNRSVDRPWDPFNPTPGGTICIDYGEAEGRGL